MGYLFKFLKMKTITFSTIMLVLLFSTTLIQAHSLNATEILSNNTVITAVQQHQPSDYNVVDKGVIIIYKRERPGDKLNLFKPVVSYYFSLKDSEKIYSLTLENLKNIYRDGKAFDLIDGNFRTDNDLVSYDAYHHQYRINYYLSKINHS
ncbi:MAG: hypothetical protein C0191_00685 [Mucilaginibacter sp.]|nr:MAG: hypothetical protein C0191_00685 [Mucilaginibacter sp.]